MEIHFMFKTGKITLVFSVTFLGYHPVKLTHNKILIAIKELDF